jgi:hypothetical protein
MTLIQEVFTVALFGLTLSVIGVINVLFWSFLFSLFFAFTISSLISRRFASGQKTLGSNGRYVTTSRVYIFFMTGIIVSSIFGTITTENLIKIIDLSNWLMVFSFSFLIAFLGYFFVKSGAY